MKNEMKTLTEQELSAINGGDGWGILGFGIGVVAVGIAVICAPVSIGVAALGCVVGLVGDAFVEEGTDDILNEV